MPIPRQRLVRLRPDDRPETRPSRRERGSASLEAVAATLLAGLLVSAILVSSSSTAAELAQKVCTVFSTVGAVGGTGGLTACGQADSGGATGGASGGGGGAGCQGGSGDQAGSGGQGLPTQHDTDPKPKKCKRKEHQEESSESITIASIKLGSSQGLVMSYFSDGSVTMTVTDGAEIGVEGGFGGGLDIGKLEAKASVDFGGGLKLGYGSTWKVKDEAEAKALEGKIRSWMTASRIGNGGAPIVLPQLTPLPPPPTETVRSFEVKAKASGTVGLSLPWDGEGSGSTSSKARSSGSGDGKGDGDKGDGDGKGDGSGSANLGGVGIEFGGSKKWTQITNTTDGTKTYTTEGQVSAEASASSVKGAAEVKALLGSNLSVTRDAENQLVSIEMTTTKPGKVTVGGPEQEPDQSGDVTQPSDDGDLTVSTAHLDLTTPEERATAEAWLQQVGSDQAAVSADTLYPKHLVEGEPFQNLMYTQAVVSNVTYKVDKSDETKFAAEVKIGVAFGVEFSSSTTDTYALAASYLGWGDGQDRQPVDFAECIAK